MVKKIQIDSFGGPEVIHLIDAPQSKPGAGQVLIRHTAIGVNFIDIYHRSGLYPNDLPLGLGMEAAGIVQELGPDVTDLNVGDRVCYCSGPIGAYAETNIVSATSIVKTPEGVSDDIAAASLLKGLTAQYLIRQIHHTQPGDTILLHAAAGGVGLIATQWLKRLGATVIGTVGSDTKAKIAKDAGCDYIILYNQEDIAARVSEITAGAKVPVVIDGVGASTWEASLNSLSPRGLLISFGNASGPVENVNLGILAAKGSLFVTRPTLYHYIDSPQALAAAAAEFFAVVKSGAVNIDITAEYPLAEAAQAHTDLAARKTTGSLILRP